MYPHREDVLYTAQEPHLFNTKILYSHSADANYELNFKN
jgi:hypothetical protein